MDSEEIFHTVFFYYVSSLRTLSALDLAVHRNGRGNVVGWELRQEILSGSYLLGKGVLSPSEEAAIQALAYAAADLPSSATSFRGDNMSDPAWSPLQGRARSIIALLEPRIMENRKYFKIDGEDV
jgi:hypothetical protein